MRFQRIQNSKKKKKKKKKKECMNTGVRERENERIFFINEGKGISAIKKISSSPRAET